MKAHIILSLGLKGLWHRRFLYFFPVVAYFTASFLFFHIESWVAWVMLALGFLNYITLVYFLSRRRMAEIVLNRSRGASELFNWALSGGEGALVLTITTLLAWMIVRSEGGKLAAAIGLNFMAGMGYATAAFWLSQNEGLRMPESAESDL